MPRGMRSAEPLVSELPRAAISGRLQPMASFSAWGGSASPVENSVRAYFPSQRVFANYSRFAQRLQGWSGIFLTAE